MTFWHPTTLDITDLSTWNLRKVESDPLEPRDAAQIARFVLKRRLGSITALSSGEPLSIYFTTRDPAPLRQGTSLSIDWSARFDSREAPQEVWGEVLIPALAEVSDLIKSEAPDADVVAEGFPSIPAALALGAAFLAPKGIRLGWRQLMPDRSTQLWSIAEPTIDSGFTAEVRWRSADADDIAVLVSVSEDVSPSFAASCSNLRWRAVLDIQPPNGFPHVLPSSAKAAHLAALVARETRAVRIDARAKGIVHLFMAGPVGLGVLVGQLLNTIGPVQTYEHIPSDAIGTYHRAALLKPGE